MNTTGKILLGTERSEVATVFYANGSVSINFRPKGGSNEIAAFYMTANQLSLHHFKRLAGKINKQTVLPDTHGRY